MYAIAICLSAAASWRTEAHTSAWRNAMGQLGPASYRSGGWFEGKLCLFFKQSELFECRSTTVRQPQVSTAPVPTQTIAARTVFHEAQAAIWPLIAGIQTQEQLENLLDSFHGIQCVIFCLIGWSLREVMVWWIANQVHTSWRKAARGNSWPTCLESKRSAQSQRITGATEGRPQGGGASIPSEKVGHSGRSEGTEGYVARKVMHTCSTCPLIPHV